jgi:hypothetical protein
MRPESAQRWLAIGLRFAGALLMTALAAVVMPTDWMAAIHRALELGDFEANLLTQYLARSISLLYAVHGAVLWLAARDVAGNRPLVGGLIILGFVFGAGMLAIDLAVGMPWTWTALEGPPVLALNAGLWRLYQMAR